METNLLRTGCVNNSPLSISTAIPKRIVSFSVYGSAPLYLAGAVRNARLVPQIYRGWTARFYVSDEVPSSVVEQLEQAGAEVVFKKRTGLIDGMFWRFLPAADPTLDACVVRDTDSRVTIREFAAVEEWIESGFSLHIMRDHPCHKVVVLGGMWGCRGFCIPDIEQLIDRWKLWAKKGQDQDFLRDAIYPRFRYDCLVHSDFYQYAGESVRAFPMERDGGEFVGCTYEPERDTLTEDQHQTNRMLLDGFTLRHLSRARRQSKLYLIAEQWIRNLRQRAA